MWSTSLIDIHWLIPVGIYVVAAYVGVRWLGKHLANQPDQLKRLLVNFSFCAAMGALFAFFTGHLELNSGVLAIGVLNGLANIQVWRAIKTSLSKTSVLAFGDDVIVVLLSVAFLGAGKYLDTVGTAGIVLCLAAGILFWLHDRKKVRESSGFYAAVAVYSVLWGVAIFATSYYALNDLPVGEFIFNWYAGTVAVIALAFAWDRLGGGGAGAKVFSAREYAMVALFAVGIVTCLGIEYWAFMLAPAAVVQPVLLVAEAIIPSAIGWTVFREGKLFDRWQWGFTALAIAGTILLGIGLPHNIR